MDDRPATERVYDDDEVARILEAATATGGERGTGSPDSLAASSAEAPARTRTPRRGLTLEELRDIGAEAGIDADRITAAALSIDRPALATRREVGLGGRTRRLTRQVPLDGPLEGEAWDRLVALLRSRFGGPGEVASEGALRSWSEGGLHAHQEPDPAGDGWRLRIETEPEDPSETLDLFGSLLLTGVVLALVGLFTDASINAAYLGGLLLAVGGVGGGWVLGRTLPRWTERREAELEALAHDVTRLAERSGGGAERVPGEGG